MQKGPYYLQLVGFTAKHMEHELITVLMFATILVQLNKCETHTMVTYCPECPPIGYEWPSSIIREWRFQSSGTWRRLSNRMKSPCMLYCWLFSIDVRRRCHDSQYEVSVLATCLISLVNTSKVGEEMVRHRELSGTTWSSHLDKASTAVLSFHGL